METTEGPEPEPAQCPLQPVRTYRPSVVAVSDAQRPLLAPADWIVSEWTPYLYRYEGATHLRVGSHFLEPLVDGIFQIQFENQLGLTPITPFRHDVPLAPQSSFTSVSSAASPRESDIADLITVVFWNDEIGEQP